MDTFYAPPTLDLELCPKTDSIISKQPFLTSALENCCPSDFYHGKFERHFTFHLRIIILHRAAHHFTQLTSPAEPSLFIMGKQSRRKRGRDPNDIIADLNDLYKKQPKTSAKNSMSYVMNTRMQIRWPMLEHHRCWPS